MLTYSLSNLFRSVFVFQCCLLNQKRVYVLVCIYFRDICFLDSHIFVLLFFPSSIHFIYCQLPYQFCYRHTFVKTIKITNERYSGVCMFTYIVALISKSKTIIQMHYLNIQWVTKHAFYTFVFLYWTSSAVLFRGE